MAGVLSPVLRERAPEGYVLLVDWCKQHRQCYSKYLHRICYSQTSTYRRIVGHYYVPIDMPVDKRNLRLTPFRGKPNPSP